MKKQVFSFASVLFLTLCFVEASHAQRRPPGPPPPPPGYQQPRPGDGHWGRDDRHDDFGRDRLVTVYRLFNGLDHMMSLDAREARHLGYRNEGGFQIFADANRDRVPLYRCVVQAGNGHFTSSDAGCEGHRNEGLLGFLAQRPSRQATRAVVRCYNGSSDHLTTLDANECYRANYRVEGTQGYAP